MVLVLACPLGAAGNSAAGPLSPARPVASAAPAALTANSTFLLGAASWNCGQGYQTVDLNARATGGVAPYTFLWSFGDGSPNSNDMDVVHLYQNVVHFTANLTVTDASNATAHSRVSGTWGMPLSCSSHTDFGWAGVALYVGLVAGVALAILLVIRGRRRRPLP
jgi:hypothetical protein